MSRFLVGVVDVVIEIDVDRIGRGTLAVSVIEELSKLAVPVVDMTTGRAVDVKDMFFEPTKNGEQANPRRRPYGTHVHP